MSENPSVLFFSSCNNYDSVEIIKLIIDSELPEAISLDEDITAYPYHIENKYYETDVNLCSVKKKTITNQQFADSVQAIVLYFDASDSKGLDIAESWLPFLNEFDAEIKILVCQKCIEEFGCGTREAQEWCIGKGYELVEIEPTVEIHEDDLEDDFPETKGVQRIIQALHAHVWPNLVMKKETKKTVQNIRDSNQGQQHFQLEESLEELLEDDDFTDLFSQLPEIKARVSNLTGNDRKDAAEQVVKAFWKAIGGDDTEFDDL